MSRNMLIGGAVILTLIDVLIHLRRSLIPDGNPFGSALHAQFLLYSVVAFVLAIAVLVAPTWLGTRAWLVQLALAVWEVGAIGAWLVAYHAPNPPGLVPDEGYVSKVLELIIVVMLLANVLRERPAVSGLRGTANRV